MSVPPLPEPSLCSKCFSTHLISLNLPQLFLHNGHVQLIAVKPLEFRERSLVEECVSSGFVCRSTVFVYSVSKNSTVL